MSMCFTDQRDQQVSSFCDSSTTEKCWCFFVLTFIVCLPIQFQSLCCKCFAKIAENDDLKNTMLEKACMEYNSIMAECLLLLGADINKKTKTNSLIYQVRHGNIYTILLFKSLCFWVPFCCPVNIYLAEHREQRGCSHMPTSASCSLWPPLNWIIFLSDMHKHFFILVQRHSFKQSERAPPILPEGN